MLSPVEMDKLVQAMPSIAMLPPELANTLQRDSKYVQMEPGQRVFEDGGKCSVFLAVLHGTVRVSKPARDGRELLLYNIRPGEFCVLTVNCLLGKAKYPAQGTTVELVTGVLIPAPLFEKMIRESPDFREATFKMLGHRLANTMMLAEEIAFQRLDQRLAAHLLRVALECECTFTHQQLAADLGCSREIVSRILESFKTQGLVQLGRKRIQLLEPAKLSQIASPVL